jgi:hypothetical protein
MLSIIIFSKDRPLQLDLALRSIYKNFKNIRYEAYVIHNSSKEYESAYVQLAHEHPAVEFNNEAEYDDGFCFLLDTLSKNSHEYLMYMTDDNIFYRESKTTELDLGNLFSRDIACISLRLGLNITHRDGYQSEQPRFERVAGYHLVWNRMSILAQSYFNYPLSVDCHIFKRETISGILEELGGYSTYNGKTRFPTNPNKFEQILQRYFFEVSPLMACELYSCVVNSPNNRVQDTIQNLHGQVHSYHQDHLLKLFNDGLRLNLEDIEFPQINCPHQEIALI